jgi:hypothetical protein
MCSCIGELPTRTWEAIMKSLLQDLRYTLRQLKDNDDSLKSE